MEGKETKEKKTARDDKAAADGGIQACNDDDYDENDDCAMSL